MDELDCPDYTDDYNTIPLLKPTPVEPTYSVVELPKPRKLAAPDPEEVADIQHTPSAAQAAQVIANTVNAPGALLAENK